MAILRAETSGAIIWFALTRFRAGEFGGVFSLDPAFLPVKGSAPVLNAAGKFWMSNQDAGFYALSQVCTHLGCLFKWCRQITASSVRATARSSAPTAKRSWGRVRRSATWIALS